MIDRINNRMPLCGPWYHQAPKSNLGATFWQELPSALCVSSRRTIASQNCETVSSRARM